MGDGNDEKDPSCMYEKLFFMDENDPAYNLEKSDKSASGLPNEDTQSQEGMEDTGNENIYEECQSSSSIYSSFRRLSPDYIEPISEKDRLWGLAVREIIDTERSYVQQLHFCVDVLLPALSIAKVEGIDLDLLFGNIGDLFIVSKHLLEKLEAAECNDVGCSIGKIMLDLSGLMEDEYMGYCCNYDAAQAALEKYMEDPQMAKIIIQQESQLKHSLPHTGNLVSILIHPVQRIMRYPLLLDNLIAKMPPELLGYAELQAATSRFKDINVSINDTKRQQDLLVKYRKKRCESVSERLSHLNINTVRKMSSRFGVQFRQAAGFLILTKDAVYEKSKSTFLELHKAIKDLLVHLPEYLQQLQNPEAEVEWLALSDTACKIWAGWNEHLADLYQRAICNIHQQHFDVLRIRLEELVQMPATDLLRTFETPLFLIQKRNDKLLDVSRSDDGDDDIQHHRSYLEYQTLHTQLLDGLPKFCAHASSLYIAIFQGFLFAHTMFFESCIGELKLLKVVGPRNEEKTSSLSMEQELEDKLSHFDFGCNIGTLYPTISHPVMVKTKSVDTGCSVRRAERRELVFQAHEPSHLYVLRANTWVGNGVDLQLLCGDIVGFLKAHDGSGSSARWLVDCGGTRGLVLACLLTPYSKMRHCSLNDGASREGTSPRTPRLGFVKTTSDYYNMSSETYFNQMLDISKGIGESCNQESVTSTETRSLQAYTASSDTTHFIAAYPFQADGPRQLDLIAGQHVHLKRSHDVSGNPEWWLVESNGSDGFVPRAYLVAANSPRHQQRPYPHQKQ